MFGRKWQKATGTVVARTIEGTDSDGSMITYNYVVEIRPAHAEPFRAVLKDPRLLTDFVQPIVGRVVGVEIDVDRGVARFDKSDPRLSFKAQQATKDAAFAAALAAPAGTPPQQPSPAASGSEMAEAVRALIGSASTGGVVRLDRTAEGYDELRASILKAAGVTDPRNP
ncbi:MAG: hypothetical protein EPO52_09890 [Herbiconiux sp.]|uniref:hypothetical protein n=1 Tax=Herbiconiux sp. TaxID=1871186 RepID=UPI0012119300|nr:hypothetical protein [Herbiconiux sp.]TAJ48435.1 MAG: hypothetical protein EPO52_09890 [Herbiconiux sp.]